MKTNILIAALLIACTFSACKDEKAEEKSQLNEVIKTHDKAMGNSELAMKNKAQLDSLAKVATDSVKVKELKSASANLAVADAAMEDWMHKFDVENKGKSHTEIMAYLKEQKAKVSDVDSVLTLANTSAAKYLTPVK